MATKEFPGAKVSPPMGTTGGKPEVKILPQTVKFIANVLRAVFVVTVVALFIWLVGGKRFTDDISQTVQNQVNTLPPGDQLTSQPPSGKRPLIDRLAGVTLSPGFLTVTFVFLGTMIICVSAMYHTTILTGLRFAKALATKGGKFSQKDKRLSLISNS